MATNNQKPGSYYQGPDSVFYYIEITLYNQIPGEQPLHVPFFLVESLTIHESLFNWVTKGEIVFNTDFEIFSRGAPYTSDLTTEKDVPYIDRTDGRNRLHIQIYPVDVTLGDQGNVTENNTDESKFPKEYWELNFDFIISDIIDLPVNNAQRKKRMYVFVDERYQILKEKNLEWSSEMIVAKKNGGATQNLPDSIASINPNEALKEILILASTNGDTMPKINVGFDDNGSIDLPNIPLDKIEDEWNVGNTSNIVNLIPLVNWNVIDSVNYVLSHCVSDDGYPVILDFGRNGIEKSWHLRSLSEYFKNSTPEQVERLIIEDGLHGAEINNDPSNVQTKDLPYLPRASNSEGTQTFNFMSIANSRIVSYEFSPMVAEDDNRIKNTSYVYYDEHTGGFSYIKKENTAKNVLSKLEGLAKMGLYSFKNGSGQILLNLNKTKTEGQSMKNVLALNGPYSNYSAPLNQMVLDAIFLNQSLTFQCMGLTIRNPGKFIFIDRVGSNEKNAFDDRFLGQWMITNVSHRFTQGSYITEVAANKVDSFASIFPTQDDKY